MYACTFMCTYFSIIALLTASIPVVYVELAKKMVPCKFRDNFGDLNKIQLWDLQQFQPVRPSEFGVWSE